ncbi:MAG: T9SS type A sorting domain-containing protein [Saprospirales bacterium]|nr:T9SS type A sorting domain-containing protein [Saprospirales bacterium]
MHSDTITINNITTGIDDNWNDDESKIKIIPNPNSGSFKIELNEKINENVSVLIYNILGEQLYSKTFKRIYDNEINIQSDIISNGLYNVVIRTKENLYSKKIEIIK